MKIPRFYNLELPGLVLPIMAYRDEPMSTDAFNWLLDNGYKQNIHFLCEYGSGPGFTSRFVFTNIELYTEFNLRFAYD